MTTPKGPAGVEECENPDCTGCAWDVPAAPAPVPNEPRFPHAFLTAVFSKDWTSLLHIKALYGWFMRQHADAEHPEAVAHIAELSTAGMSVASSLAEARSFVPMGLYCQPRQEGEDPTIVETWF